MRNTVHLKIQNLYWSFLHTNVKLPIDYYIAWPEQIIKRPDYLIYLKFKYFHVALDLAFKAKKLFSADLTKKYYTWQTKPIAAALLTFNKAQVPQKNLPLKHISSWHSWRSLFKYNQDEKNQFLYILHKRCFLKLTFSLLYSSQLTYMLSIRLWCPSPLVIHYAFNHQSFFYMINRLREQITGILKLVGPCIPCNVYNQRLLRM